MMGAKMSLLDVLEMLQGAFGDGTQSQWFYEEDLCPCCRARKLSASNFGKKQMVSLNSFFYRPRSLVITYPLCSHCGPRIMRENEQGPMHRAIEENLVAAYDRFMALNES